MVAEPALTEVGAAPTGAERIVPHAVSADFAEAADLRASLNSPGAEMPGVGLRWRDAARRVSAQRPAALVAGSKACWAERLHRSEHVDSTTPAGADAARRLSIRTPAVLDGHSRARWAEPLLRSEHAGSTTPAAADAARDGSWGRELPERELPEWALPDLWTPDVPLRSEAVARCAPACSAVAALP